MTLFFHGYIFKSLSITPEETGCSRILCDKKIVLYDQVCCWYSYEYRGKKFIVDNALNIENPSLQEDMHVPNYSSAKSSLLCQTSVFISQVQYTLLELTDTVFNKMM